MEHLIIQQKNQFEENTHYLFQQAEFDIEGKHSTRSSAIVFLVRRFILFI